MSSECVIKDECRLEFQDIAESLGRLEDVPERQDKMMEVLLDMKSDIGALKVKSGIWGMIGGMFPVLLAIAYILIKG